jgi:myotubularin-related protein 1/2
MGARVLVVVVVRGVVWGGPGERAGSRWLSLVESSGWLDHLSRLLSAASEVAARLADAQQTVVLHCSDGWDRTAQLAALATLLLDPRTRTRRGFAVLVEREWLAAGHKFTDRLGHAELSPAALAAPSTPCTNRPSAPARSQHELLPHRQQLFAEEGTGMAQASAAASAAAAARPVERAGRAERSPVFFQWLDCVHQLLRQFPHAFEYNERFLLAVHEHSTSGLFGTFLHNNERARVLGAAAHKTASVWSQLLADTADTKKHLVNPDYRPPPPACTATPPTQRPAVSMDTTANLASVPEEFAELQPGLGVAGDQMGRATEVRLRPRTGPAHLALWDAHFTRWLRDPSSSGLDAHSG